jgi:hypothetical protein
MLRRLCDLEEADSLLLGFLPCGCAAWLQQFLRRAAAAISLDCFAISMQQQQHKILLLSQVPC